MGVIKYQGGFPPCFGALDLYLAWLDARRDAERSFPEGKDSERSFLREGAGQEVAVSYCHDCTPAFQAEALARGECLHPETFFIEVWGDENEKETIGVR